MKAQAGGMNRSWWVGVLGVIVSMLVMAPGSAWASSAPTPVWTQESPAASPSARSSAAMAFDSGTGQLVLFGGSSTTGNVSDTWVWNGSTWAQQSPTVSPAARSDASMAYDPGTGQLVLFGGSGAGGVLSDTWVWNGTTWAQQSPTASPPARQDASLAYDAATGQLVLFGGKNSVGTPLGDTWVWNGSNWSQQSPASSPPARKGASMDYDAGTGQLILFGGYASNGALLNDTWEWNGSTWTQLSPASSPPARQSATMAYDPGSGQLTLFGGQNANSADTWTWDGSTWTKQSPSTSPPDRAYSEMAYDAGSGQLVLFGGLSGTTKIADTWVWAPSSALPISWTQQTPAVSPSARGSSAMAYDAGSGQLVLFSGNPAQGSALTDTWVWNGMTWAQQSPATSPPSRSFASMAYDPATGQLVLFGGVDDNNNDLNDTWVWTGSTWIQESPVTSPPVRDSASMAYDAKTGQLILFGGENPSSYLGDTWEWNGSTWTQLSPAASPPARAGASMAYDPGSGQLVLFGGNGFNGELNDTWVWTGSTWTKLAPATSPSGRTDAAMAYDPGTGQLVLFSGPRVADTWVWNGTTWAQQSPAASPPARLVASMDYDAGTGQLVLFGGQESGVYGADTWVWGPTLLSQTVAFTSAAPTGATVGGAFYTATATGGMSGNPVVFTVDSAATTNAACVISGAVVSFQHAGSCVIDANQAGNGEYDSAQQAQQTFAVGKGSQVLAFAAPAPTDAVVGGAPYTPGASSSSRLAVSVTVDASTTNSACVIADGVVSFQHVGSCVIDANQAGNADYNPAPQTHQSISVGKGSQSVAFSSPAPTGVTVGGGSYTPQVSSSSGLTVSVSIDASTTNSACVVASGAVSFSHVGSCVIDANQAGNGDYTPAQQQQTITVGQGTQSVAFTSPAPSGAVVGGSSYTPSASGGASGNPVLFSVDGSTTGAACSISGGVVSFESAGSCVIDAHQAGSGDYAAAAQVMQTIMVSAPAPAPAPAPTPAPTTTTTPTTKTTPTTTTTPTPAPVSKPVTVRAVLDDQQIVLETPASGVCLASPVRVSLASTLIKGSKAKRVTFLKAAFYIGKGVKHTRRVTVHAKTRTVVTYAPNVVVHTALSTARLRAAKGVHVLKVVLSYRVRVTRGHTSKLVTITKTITGKLEVC